MTGQQDPETPTPPRQLPLPDCSISKTRRRSGKPLRRVNTTRTLSLKDIPPDVVEILKRMAKREKMTYTAYCREVLQAHAYAALRMRP